MPAGVPNERSFRNSDGLKPKLGEELLNFGKSRRAVIGFAPLPWINVCCPRRRISDCLDNLPDCVDHKLGFLGLNVVRTFGRGFMFGIWRKSSQSILRRVPRLVQCSGEIDGQGLPR